MLTLFLLIDGFLFYRYQLMETTAASVPSLEDAVPSAAKEDYDPSEQEEEPGDKGPDNEAARSDGEKKGNLEAQENDPASAPTPYPPPDSAPPAGSPTPVAPENVAVLPAQQEAPVGAYPNPVYEE